MQFRETSKFSSCLNHSTIWNLGFRDTMIEEASQVNLKLRWLRWSNREKTKRISNRLLSTWPTKKEKSKEDNAEDRGDSREKLGG